MKFRKKPVVIEAFQWTGNPKSLFNWASTIEANTTTELGISSDNVVTISTLEGIMTVSIGDWIILGVDKELYPCKPLIFVKTYEPVGE